MRNVEIHYDGALLLKARFNTDAEFDDWRRQRARVMGTELDMYDVVWLDPPSAPQAAPHGGYPTLIDETIVTDPTTGGQKGVKLARFDLIPPSALEELACVYGRGATKYADNNWRKGYAWGLSIGALERHLTAWKKGIERDEMGNHHLLQVAWHAFALYTFQKFGLGTDDRPEAQYDIGDEPEAL